MTANLSYRDKINKLIEYNANLIIPNSNTEHAKEILDAIVDNSKKKIRIFSGKLDSCLYDDAEFIRSVIDFINNGGVLEIIVQTLSKNEIKELSIYKKLTSLAGVSFYSGCGSKNVTDSDIHFQIGDDKMYRKEFDTVKHKALVNFNDFIVASALITQFDKFKSESETIS